MSVFDPIRTCRSSSGYVEPIRCLDLTALALSTGNKALLLVDRTDDRAQARRRRCAAEHFTPPRRHLRAPLCQGPDDHGLAHGGCLARQVDGSVHKERRRLSPAPLRSSALVKGQKTTLRLCCVDQLSRHPESNQNRAATQYVAKGHKRSYHRLVGRRLWESFQAPH